MSTLQNVMKYGKKAISTFLVANAIYFGGFLIGANVIHRAFSPSIKTQSELELKLEEERKRLGIKDNIIIRANLSSNPDDNSYAKKLEDNVYEINLEPEVGHNLDVLRHELYHIADGHCDDGEKVSDSFIGGLKYLYIYEPQAVLYSISGIKL